MPITLNGTTGVVTPGATVGSITGILKATSGVVAQAVAGSDYGQLTLATAQTASGTAVDFTGIPSWAKRITVMFSGVSTNGTSPVLIQIGSGSVTTSGYASSSVRADATGNGYSSSTAGFIISTVIASVSVSGAMSVNAITSTVWVASHSLNIGTQTTNGGGTSGTLSGALDRVRITTVGGTDTFDAGTINISYE
jgi:hypothetical protein